MNRISKIKPYIRAVNYYETDQMHVVHHSNYARYMEEARLDMMNQIGLSYDKMEEMGIIIPVLELHNVFTNAIHYGDIISIQPSLVKLTPVRFGMHYEFYDAGTGAWLNRADTSHAFVDTDFRPMNLKKKYPEVYAAMEALLQAQEEK